MQKIQGNEPADRLREAEALLAIASAVSSTTDFQETLRRVCRELARLIGADTASVHLHDRDSDRLFPFAGYHIPKEHLQVLSTTPLPLKDQGFYLPLWKERRPIYSDDVAHDPRFSHELFRLIPHQSGLLLPLVLDDEVAGGFYLVWWTARHHFTDRELGLMESVAAQVRFLLRHARLHDQATRDQRRLEALYEVSRSLVGTRGSHEILSLIVDQAARLLSAEAAGIRLLEGKDLVLGARTESAAAVMARPRLKANESLSGLVVSRGVPVVVEDAGEDPRHDPAHRQAALAAGFRGFLGVPLRAHGQLIGVISVYTKGRRRFTPDEASLLSAFADQAALAIHQARLYEELQSQRMDLAARVRDLEDALARVKQLQGLLPICAWCKKVRRDKNYWQSVEGYVAEHSEARFSHGICPECKEKLVSRRESHG